MAFKYHFPDKIVCLREEISSQVTNPCKSLAEDTHTGLQFVLRLHPYTPALFIIIFSMGSKLDT